MKSDELLIKTYSLTRKISNQLRYWGKMSDDLFERQTLNDLSTDFANIAKKIIANFQEEHVKVVLDGREQARLEHEIKASKWSGTHNPDITIKLEKGGK